MMTTIISGQIGWKDLYAVSTDKRDVGLGVALLDPSQAPLVLLTQTGMDARKLGAPTEKVKLNKAVTGNPKVEWVEDELVPMQDAVNSTAGYSAAVTSIAVDNGPYFYTGCYGYVKRTGEIFLVTTVATNQLSVIVRGAIGTTAAALLDNDEIIILDIAHEEGATIPTARSTRKSLQYNYTEITRTVINMTRTTQKTNMLGEERDMPYQIRKNGIEHAIKLENKFLWGSRSISYSGTEAKRTMNGLAHIITTNVFDSGGTLTQTDFDREVLEECFKKGRGSSYRLVLCSQRMNSVICGWGKDLVRLNVSDRKFGFVVNEYVSPSGVVYIIPHHLITGTTGISAFVLDPEKIKYRYLTDSDTMLEKDVVKAGTDGTQHQYLSEVTLEVRNEQCHAIVKNVEN